MQCGPATEWRAVQHAAFVVAQPRLVVSEKIFASDGPRSPGVETVRVLVRGGTVALGRSRHSTLTPRQAAEEVQIGIAMFRTVDALRRVTSVGCRRPGLDSLWPGLACGSPEHSHIRIGVQLVGAGCPQGQCFKTFEPVRRHDRCGRSQNTQGHGLSPG
jgi:hypothetical protein